MNSFYVIIEYMQITGGKVWPVKTIKNFRFRTAQLYLPHVTPRVPRNVHAKFHADWTKTDVGARGIHRDKQQDKQTNRPVLMI